MKWCVGLALALSPLIAGEAWGCSILPPVAPPQVVVIPGESPEAFEARSKLHYDGFAALQEKKARDAEAARQAELWDSAHGAVLVRYLEASDNVKLPPFGMGRSVLLKPVVWLKGTGSKANLKVAHQGHTSCGPMPNWDIFGSEYRKDHRFVIFYTSKGRSSSDVGGAIAVNHLVDPRIIAAIAGELY